MPLGREVGLGPGNIVLDGDPAPTRKRDTAPQFSAHVYCGQTAGWIKITLRTDVGLGPGNILCSSYVGDPRVLCMLNPYHVTLPKVLLFCY